MSNHSTSREVAELQKLLSRLSGRLSRAGNSIVYWSCIGLSGTVFLAWQYALRDGRTLLADSSVWRPIDRRTNPSNWRRVREFLELNFCVEYSGRARRPWTLITSAFSHKDFAHLVTNLLSFTTFFTPLSWSLSPLQIGSLLVSSALSGNFAFLEQQRRRVSAHRSLALGLSGVVSGMGMAVGVLYPKTWMNVSGIPMPVWFALAGYVAWDAYFLESTVSTTAHAAHLGGAAAGLVYALSLKHFELIQLPRWAKWR